MERPGTQVPKLHGLMAGSATLTFLLMLGVSLLPLNGLPLLAVVISLLTAQLSLIALVVFLSTEPLSRRVWNAAVYACGLYFAIFVPPALVADRFGYGALVTAHIGIGLLTAYAGALAWLQGSIGLRLSMDSSAEAVPSAIGGRPQFRLIDLMKWVTLICVALGIWSTVTSRFLSSEPLLKWSGAYYVYSMPPQNEFGTATALAGGPLMLLNLGAYWMVLSSSPARQPWLIGVFVLWLFSIFTCYGFTIVLLPALVPAALHALAMRRLGWQMTASRNTRDIPISRRL